MNETLEAPAAALDLDAISKEYEEYRQRNSSNPKVTPLAFEDWLKEEGKFDAWQAVLAPAQALDSSPSSSATREGTINYGNGNQIVVSPNISPVFNNNPNINVGGQQNLGSGNIEVPQTRQIEVISVLGPPGEAPAAAPEAPNGNEPWQAEMEQLRALVTTQGEQIETLGAQIQALTEALEAQNTPDTDPVPTTDPDLDPLPDTDPVPTTDPDQEAQQAAQNQEALDNALNIARDELVKVTIRRKGRMSDKFTVRPDRGGEDKDSYDQLLQEYISVIEMSAGFLRDRLEQEGKSPAEIAQEITKFVYGEQKIFAEREVSLNDEMLDDAVENSTWSRPWTKSRKLLRKWANVSTKKKLLIGLGVGAGVALVSGTAGLGLAGLAAGSAVKFSLGLVNRRASLMNVPKNGLDKYTAHLDKDLQKRLAEILGDNPDDLESRLLELSQNIGGELDDRIKKAQRRNKLGNGILVLSAVSLGVAASGVEFGLLDSTHNFGIGGHHSSVTGGSGQEGPGLPSSIHHSGSALGNGVNHGGVGLPQPGDHGAGSLPGHLGAGGEVTPISNPDSYAYPWNWGVHEVGPDHAETWLHDLANRAAQDGHHVEWHTGGALPDGQSSEWVSVDGKSSTKDVIEILNGYRRN